MAKKIKEKMLIQHNSIKKIVFATRNKEVVLYSKLFGSEKTNEILERCFSNNLVVSKVFEAERHGFEVSYDPEENKNGVYLSKEINEPGLDNAKIYEAEYLKKYWNSVRENLLKSYDEETTDAIIEHFNPLIDKNGSEIIYNLICPLEDMDKSDANISLRIDFYISVFLDPFYSNIEKEVGNKIIKYKVDREKILSAFIDSLIQMFG